MAAPHGNHAKSAGYPNPPPVSQENYCVSFDVIPDNQQLICNAYNPFLGYGGAQQIPATINIRPITGGTLHTIYHGPVGYIKASAISNSTLLFTTSGKTPDTLWKINTDGSGLLQLMTTSTVNNSIQSMDCNGSFYAVMVYDHTSTTGNGTSLILGSLAGGTPKIIGGPPDNIEFIGWSQL